MNNSYKDFFDKAQTQKGVRRTLPADTFASDKKKVKAAPRKQRPVKRLTLILTSLGFVLTLAGTFFLDQIVHFFSKIEIGFIGNALAEEKPTNNKPEAAKEEATKGETKNPSKDENGATQASASKDNGEAAVDEVELDHFARLRDRKKELDQREGDLNKLEAEIAHQRQEVEQKIKELEDVRRKISSVLEEKVQIDEQRVDNLVQFYSNMKAPQAAKIVETLDEDLAVQVITKMKKKNAADIMNLLKPEKAQAISEKYVGYRK